MVIMPEYKQKYTAQQARAFVDKRKLEERLHQVPRVLNYIQDVVYMGTTEISLKEFPNLEEEHFKELEDLGFKIVRPEYKRFISMCNTEQQELFNPGSVSW